MSLDIAMIDKTGKPKLSVPLTVDEHGAIIQLVKRLALPLWSRMTDYYQDTDYLSDEVFALVDETSQLQHSCQDMTIVVKLNEIEKIMRVAIDEHKPVSAIAD